MMKKLYLGIVILLSVVLFACGRTQTNNKEGLPYIIDFEQCISNARNIKISELADTIELIELKTPEELPVSMIWNFIPVEDFWFLHTSEGIFKFTNKGEYITTIGKHGQGPGEYPVVFDISVDKYRKEFIINSYQRMLF